MAIAHFHDGAFAEVLLDLLNGEVEGFDSDGVHFGVWGDGGESRGIGSIFFGHEWGAMKGAGLKVWVDEMRDSEKFVFKKAIRQLWKRNNLWVLTGCGYFP